MKIKILFLLLISLTSSGLLAQTEKKCKFNLERVNDQTYEEIVSYVFELTSEKCIDVARSESKAFSQVGEVDFFNAIIEKINCDKSACSQQDIEELYKSACRKGAPDACLFAEQRERTKKNLSNSEAEYAKPICENGSAEACLHVAGTMKDAKPEDKLVYYEKACGLKSRRACTLLQHQKSQIELNSRMNSNRNRNNQ